MKRVRCNRRELGLSLLELIIALALMGMIAVISYPSLSLIIKSWTRIEFGSTSSDDFAVERFVRQSIEQAMPVLARERSTREKLLVFDGSTSSLSFVSPIDYLATVPGLYLTTFKIERSNSLQTVTFSYTLYREGIEQKEELENGREGGLARPRAILENISDAELRYYSAKKKSWLSEWQDKKYLPLLISLSFTDNKDNPQQWIMSPKLARPIYRYENDPSVGT